MPGTRWKLARTRIFLRLVVFPECLTRRTSFERVPSRNPDRLVAPYFQRLQSQREKKTRENTRKKTTLFRETTEIAIYVRPQNRNRLFLKEYVSEISRCDCDRSRNRTWLTWLFSGAYDGQLGPRSVSKRAGKSPQMIWEPR